MKKSVLRKKLAEEEAEVIEVKPAIIANEKKIAKKQTKKKVSKK